MNRYLSELHHLVAEKTAPAVVVGLGYVGLPVACMLARVGFPVTGVDIDPQKVARINAGALPLGGREPGMAELLADVVASGRLRASSDYTACQAARVVLISVETPVETTDRRPAYRALRRACEEVGRAVRPGTLVIVESTIAPGTMATVVQPLLERASGLRVGQELFLGHCPERVMAGRLLANLEQCARAVGGMDAPTAELAVALYRHIVRGDLDATDCLTAELVKTAENAYRDVQIAFANEVALLCENVGADVYRVRELVNKSPQRNMHMPGAGVGGHCISKDPWLLIHGTAGPNPARLMPVARAINDGMPLHVAGLVRDGLAEAGREVSAARVAVLGYAFREDSDDTRNTPSEPLATRLREWGAEVVIHDPYVAPYAVDWESCVAGADCVVLMVRHSAYSAIALERLAERMRTQVLVDGRGMFDKATARRVGFVYKGVGNL